MLETLKRVPGEWAKGQVTGPISFGLIVTDQNLRASLYDEMLCDAIVKNMGMNARWQVRQLKTVADELGASLAQLSLAWCAANPHVSSVITGASRVEQVRENLGALEVIERLTDDVLARIDRIMAG